MKTKPIMHGYYVFSPATRLFHWNLVICIFLLFFTGLYIGNPFFIGSSGVEPTYAVNNLLSMENIRYVHFLAGYILMASLILRLYGFITHKGDRLFPKFWTRGYWDGLIDTQLHYMFLRTKHKPYLRNSLARTGYASVYGMILLEGVTGFAMYAMIRPNGSGAQMINPVNHWLVDEYMVHVIHHYVAWMIMLFVIVHVYMVFRADVMEKGGETSGMISGRKFYEEEPVDHRDLGE